MFLTLSEAYTEEAKIKIYTATGIISTLLVVLILGFTVMTIRKRNKRKLSVLLSNNNRNNVDNGNVNFGLSKKSVLEISNPLEPWTTNEEVRKAFPNIIRSNAWFDSLQR
jgi:hypothetical protein